MARISYLQGSVLQGAYIPSLLLTDRVESQYHVWGGYTTWDFSAPLKEISGWSCPLAGIHGNERKHKTGNQPKRKGETDSSPSAYSKPTGKTTLELPLPVQKRKDKKEVESGRGREGEANEAEEEAASLSTLPGDFAHSEWGHWGNGDGRQA